MLRKVREPTHYPNPGIMQKEVTEEKNRPAMAERSSLYREFLAEREEIIRHKWLSRKRPVETSVSSEPCSTGSETTAISGKLPDRRMPRPEA